MGGILGIFNIFDVNRKQSGANDYCRRKYGVNSVYKSATRIGGPVSCQDKDSHEIQEEIPYDKVQEVTGVHNIIFRGGNGNGSRSRRNKRTTNKRKKKASNNKNKTKK
jgi:hypothetical protein